MLAKEICIKSKDSWVVELAAEIIAEIKHKCFPDERPAHKIKDDYCGLLYGCPNPLYLSVPEGAKQNTYYSFFSDTMRPQERIAFLDPYEREAVLEIFEASLDKGKLIKGGRIKVLNQKNLVVIPTNARTMPIDEVSVAEAIYFYQFNSKKWNGAYAQADFYPACIGAHLKSDSNVEPIDWVSQRAKIVLGYSFELLGRDYPVFFIEDVYGRVASKVCNSYSPEMLKPRRYNLDEHANTLIASLRINADSPLSPDALILTIENKNLLTPQNIEDPELKNFFNKLPQLINNGLIIDRVTELAQSFKDRGLEPSDSFITAAKITYEIYGSKEKPWWFKENFSIKDAANLLSSGSSQELAEDLNLLAKHSKFGFVYAVNLYGERQKELSGLKGLDKEAAIKFCCNIAAWYGIGNHRRAGNVMDYAVQTLEENPPESRHLVLAKLENLLKRRKPASPLIGKLEGEAANFEKPGIADIGKINLDRYLPKGTNLHQITVNTGDLRAITETFALPVETRAFANPNRVLNTKLKTPLLLTESLYKQKRKALSTAVTSSNNAIALKSPLTAWMKFDEQLHKECGSEAEHIAHIYFTFCANKFNNPLKPPAGFLRFLKDYDAIPNPDYEHTLLISPYELGARERASEQNARRTINRYGLIHTLLESQVLGLTTWPELKATFDWLIPGILKAERKTIEEGVSWSIDESAAGSQQYHLYELAKHDDNLLDELRRNQHRFKREWFEAIPVAQEFYAEKVNEIAAKREQLIEDYCKKHEREYGYRPHLFQEESFGKKDREYAKRDIESAVSDLSAEKRLKRLYSLEVAIRYFASVDKITELVSFNVQKSSLSEILEALRSEEDISWFNKETSELSRNLSIDSLKKAEELGAIDFSGVDQGKPFGLKDVVELLKTGQQITTVFEKLNDYVMEVKTTSADASARNKGELISEVTGLLEGFNFLAPNAAEILVDELYWPARYVGLSEYKQQVFLAVKDRHYDANQIFPDSVQNANSIFMEACLFQTFLRGGNNSRQQEDSATLISSEALRYRDIQRRIREDSFGFLPVGGKIHVLHEIDQRKLEYLKENLGFSSTAFMLQHANHSLVLPAMPSSHELKFVITMLNNEKVISWEYPELQICSPGRLPADDCAVLGASILLSTEIGIEYGKESFKTNQNEESGLRIMLYDKNGYRSEYPFSTKIPGRTDMLGRRSLNDIDNYQLVQTVLLHSHDEGPFGMFAQQYRKDFKQILEGYGLEAVLGASWIKPHDEPFDFNNGKNHLRNAVLPCTTAWFNWLNANKTAEEEKGIVTEMRLLINKLREDVRVVQQNMLIDKKYEKQRAMLLEF